MKDELITTASPDFIALVDYLPTAAGGRSTPVFSGYRSSIRFLHSNIQVPGEQQFLDKETVHPGQQATAALRLATLDFFLGKMEIGLPLEVLEGNNVVAMGKVTEIINEKLRTIGY